MKTMVVAFLIVVSITVPEKTNAQWSTFNFTNEWGETLDKGARSAPAKPIRPMSFTYRNLTARIYVDCENVWVRFTTAPNLVGGSNYDGHEKFNAKIRIDGKSVEEDLVFRQKWGDDDLVLRRGYAWERGKSYPAGFVGLVDMIRKGSTMSIALEWYGENTVVFTWSLSGSSKAIVASCDGVPIKPVVTVSQYNSIEKGMSYVEVNKLLGVYKGDLIKEDDLGKTYKWRNIDGSGMNATFDEYDMLVQKKWGIKW